MPDHSNPTPTLPKRAPARSTETLNLPNPRHAQRVPLHISKEQVARIRQSAYNLPQVVKPGDYLPENSEGLETHLDQLGMVLLQIGQRGRWQRQAAEGKGGVRCRICGRGRGGDRAAHARLS